MFETAFFQIPPSQTGRSEIVDCRESVKDILPDYRLAPVKYGNYTGIVAIKYLVPIEASISGLPSVQYVSIDGSIDEGGELITPAKEAYVLKARILIEDKGSRG
jgi:hypothetical protein